MKQYLNLLENILQNGVRKESGRANMPDTIGVSHAVISHDMADGFPLLTTKKMFLKGIIIELIWFLRGWTNIKFLVDNGVGIWNGDAYRWYLQMCKETGSDIVFDTIDNFISYIKNTKYENLATEAWFRGEHYYIGSIGKGYGYQWRNQNKTIDQVGNVITGLRSNPYSRYHIINAWNAADFDAMALPPCHLLYQFIVRPLSSSERILSLSKNPEYVGVDVNVLLEDPDGSMMEVCDNEGIPKFYLDLNMYQRSCDTFLGVPFNIASMALLNMVVANACNMIPGVINWIGGDTHLYVNHVDAAREQLTRNPLPLPRIVMLKELNTMRDIESLTYEDFGLIEYNHHPAIKAELSTGLNTKS